LVNLWVGTLQVTVLDPLRLLDARTDRAPRVFAFLHGQQMALLAARPRGAAVMVSHSADGELQAAVMRTLSFVVVRGSSSRGGARALSTITRQVRAGVDAVFAVDGPRGPYGVPKPGAALTALSGGASLVPVAAVAHRAVVLRRTWDRFAIPLPFSRVTIAVGSVIPATDVTTMTTKLGEVLPRLAAVLEISPWPTESQ
jgi:lysophospholipid acyltransferase (LPLAT)-like uncharacterized protein